MNRPKRILLIDHEPHLAAVVSTALQASGQYLVRQESYSRQVLETAVQFQPDLILLDAQPERLEIDEVAQQIHADRASQDVPVLCLTSPDVHGPDRICRFPGRLYFRRQSVSTRRSGPLYR